MPNNKGMRRQQQPGEVGGAKLLSPLLLLLNSVELAERRAKSCLVPVRRLSRPFGQCISVTYPRNFLGPRDPKRIDRA